MVVKIAARQSDLARLQAFEVGRALEKAQLDRGGTPLKIEYAFRSSLGDQRSEDPLWKMPEKGVFTEDFSQDLKRGAIDIVVHSWKDLPIGPREGTTLAATLKRADARDLLLVRKDLWRSDLPVFRVLTSSPRRSYNLRDFLKWALPFSSPPKIEFVPVRGNIATRVRKLVNPDPMGSTESKEPPHALVVAKAAIDRLLTSSRYGDEFASSEKSLRDSLLGLDFVVLPLLVNPTAAAQGALAIEVRNSRPDLLELCRAVDHSDDREAVEAERAELARHGGGCHQKIGVTYLKRSYGEIRFLRGLTDAGEVLNAKKLVAPRSAIQSWPPLKSRDEIFSAETKDVRREKVLDFVWPQSSDPTSDFGFFVARADAWPGSDQPQIPETKNRRLVWTAGLETWRKLAEKGVWVHGSSESLGEVEDPQLDILVSHKIDWVKLTHVDAAKEGAQFSQKHHEPLGTYRIDVTFAAPQSFLGKKYFFWKSGSQFQAALSVGQDVSVRHQITNGYHASGPGLTHEAIRQGLNKLGVSQADIEKRVAIFLSESDFCSQLEEKFK